MEECSTGDVMYFGAGDDVVKLFDQGIDGVLSGLASAILTAAVNLFTNIANDIPTFNKDDDTVNKIGTQLTWLVIVIAIASLLFSASRMALERQGTAGISALRGLVRMVLVTGAGTWVIRALADAGDKYSNYLYEAGVKEEIKTIAECGTHGGVAFLLILVGLLLLIAGVIHIILLYIRLGVMVVLTAALPLSASASMTEWGSSWWRKHIAWLVAWLVFKPATGLVIYAGVVMINASSSNAIQQKIAGCGVLLLSAVALPALLRLVVPAAAALGASDGVAGIAAAGGAAAGRLATGAVANKAAKHSGAAGGGSGGGSGRQGPSGASGGGGRQGAAGQRAAGGLGAALARGAAGAARGTVGAVGAAAASASRNSRSAARHADNVVQGALPGVHDNNQ